MCEMELVGQCRAGDKDIRCMLQTLRGLLKYKTFIEQASKVSNYAGSGSMGYYRA